MGRHQAYKPTVTERTNVKIDAWLSKNNLTRPRLPRVKKGKFNSFYGFCAAVGLAAVSVVDPYSGSLTAAQALALSNSESWFGDQNLVSDETVEVEIKFARGGFNLISGNDYSAIFVADAGEPEAGSPKAFARKLGLQLGWGQDQYSCLVKLWTRESHWNHLAENPGSGAYGIPQALPGRKMATEGADWRTNPETQIKWGVKYIEGRYSNPCNALRHSDELNWY